MPRLLLNPSASKTIIGKLELYNGGTGATDSTTALTNLDGIPATAIGAPNGPVQLDNNGKIAGDVLLAVDSVITLDGKDVLVAGSLHQFTITNYDRAIVYTVTVTAGTVIRTDDIISYRAPTTPGSYTLTVNNLSLVITVVDNISTTPSIISPTNVSIDNSTITHIVASPYATDGPLEIGTLLASDAAVNDAYGTSVALDSTGTILAVGAVFKDTVAGVGAGQVYIYDWDGTAWVERVKLLASDAAVNDLYGISVALDSTGTILAVGAHGKDTVAGVDAGQVYIYDWDVVSSTWIERNKLTASDGAANETYGVSVSLDSTGNILAVGANAKDTVTGVDAGQAYIYDWDSVSSTWVERVKLLASDAAVNDRYSRSVVLDSTGTILAVGAIGKDTVAGVDAGQVYIYDWDAVSSTWIERSILLASDGAANDHYGMSVSLDTTGTILAVGAYNKDTVAGVDAGQVYIYDWDGTVWIERTKLRASDGAVGDDYGISAAFDSTGTILMVGAHQKDTTAGVNAGQVYMVTPSYHTSSDWQLATDVDFTNIVQSSLNDTVHLESWDVSGLAIATDYYVRVRYHANQYGPSAWSPVSEFTTKTNNIPTLEYLTLRASDAAVSDHYGRGVSISADGLVLAVGSYLNDTVAGIDAGQVYIYDWDSISSTWVERTLLRASDAAVSDSYGHGVSLNSTGTILAVGALGKDTVAGVDAGQVYIYDWDGTTWIERTKLLASDGAASNWYGVTVSLNNTGTILAVGSHGKDTVAGIDAGQVYIYDWDGTTWIERVKLTASDAAVSDYYGISTSLNSTGTILAVGALGKDTVAGVDAGQVYIYDWDAVSSTWIERGTIIASDGTTSDQYGISVSLNSTGTILVVGAFNKDTVAGIDAGQVYIYDWDSTSSTWIERSMLRASDGAASDFYGHALDINGDATILMVGSSAKDTVAGVDAGQVYMYI